MSEGNTERYVVGRWRVAPWALGMALVFSLASNAHLVRLGNEYFRQTSEVRLDPAGRKVYENAPAPTGSRPVLLFFGDSRALMWSPPRALSDYEIVNRGIANQTTAQILLRFDEDVPKIKPSVVVLEAGVNDIKVIAELPERRAAIVADCERNLRQLVARCRATGATVVLVNIFGIGDVALWRRPFWSSDVAEAVKEVNRFLPSVVGDGVVLFEATKILEDEHGRIRAPYQYDFLHLTPAGYGALNENLVPIVRALPR
jgi:lysophospholipase L1-like esterase